MFSWQREGGKGGIIHIVFIRFFLFTRKRGWGEGSYVLTNNDGWKSTTFCDRSVRWSFFSVLSREEKQSQKALPTVKTSEDSDSWLRTRWADSFKLIQNTTWPNPCWWIQNSYKCCTAESLLTALNSYKILRGRILADGSKLIQMLHSWIFADSSKLIQNTTWPNPCWWIQNSYKCCTAESLLTALNSYKITTWPNPCWWIQTHTNAAQLNLCWQL